MLQILLAGVILLGIYKFMNEPDGEFVSLGATCAFILVPAFLMIFLGLGLNALEQNPNWVLLGYLFYFLIPFAWLRHFLEFDIKSAFKFSIVVPIVAIVTEVIFINVMAYFSYGI